MASVYQTQEWRQGGGPPGQEHPLHTDLGGGSRRRGIRDLNSSRVQLDWAGGRRWRVAALEGLEGICSLWVEKQRRPILGRKDIF